jgi:hypothetical protein
MITVSKHQCPIINVCNTITKMNCNGRVLTKDKGVLHVNCGFFENALADYCEIHHLRQGTCNTCKYTQFCSRPQKEGPRQ